MIERVTIIGGTGFIGRRLVERLKAENAALRIVARRARESGGGSAVEQISGNILDVDLAERAVRDSWAVINLVGTTAVGTREDFFALHRDAPQRLAAAALRAGAKRFVHFSAMGVSSHAPALADRSKAAGETAVLGEFPDANLIRPALVFGQGDHFFGRFIPLVARSPVIPLIGGGHTRFQPMHVDDVIEGVARILRDDATKGRLFELGGAEVLSLRQLLERLCDAMSRRPWFLDVPSRLAEVLATLLEQTPGAPLTADQVRLLRTDKTMTADSHGPSALGIEPRSLESFYARLAAEHAHR